MKEWQRIKSDDEAWTDCFIRIEDDYVTIADSNCGGEPDAYNSVLVHASQWAKIWEAIQPSVDHEMDKWRYAITEGYMAGKAYHDRARSFDEAMMYDGAVGPTLDMDPAERPYTFDDIRRDMEEPVYAAGAVRPEKDDLSLGDRDEEISKLPEESKCLGAKEEALSEEQVTKALRKLGSTGVTLAEAIETWSGTKRDIIFVDETSEISDTLITELESGAMLEGELPYVERAARRLAEKFNGQTVYCHMLPNNRAIYHVALDLTEHLEQDDER